MMLSRGFRRCPSPPTVMLLPSSSSSPSSLSVFVIVVVSRLQRRRHRHHHRCHSSAVFFKTFTTVENSRLGLHRNDIRHLDPCPLLPRISLAVSLSLCLCLCLYLFSRVLRDSTPRFVGPSLGPLVRWSVHHTLLFWGFCGLWPHCSCPNDEATSNIAPAHPHAT